MNESTEPVPSVPNDPCAVQAELAQAVPSVPKVYRLAQEMSYWELNYGQSIPDLPKVKAASRPIRTVKNLLGKVMSLPPNYKWRNPTEEYHNP